MWGGVGWGGVVWRRLLLLLLLLLLILLLLLVFPWEGLYTHIPRHPNHPTPAPFPIPSHPMHLDFPFFCLATLKLF